VVVVSSHRLHSRAHLLVHVGKESHPDVFHNVTTQLNRKDLNPGHVLFYEVLDIAHAWKRGVKEADGRGGACLPQRVTARITHSMP